jgi:hypothetical protein
MIFDPERVPSFNPYAALIGTGALMLATVLISEGGPGLELARAGARSLDRDVATLVAKASASVQQFAAVHFGQPSSHREERESSGAKSDSSSG